MDLALPSDWLCVETISMMFGGCMLTEFYVCKGGWGEVEGVPTLEGWARVDNTPHYLLELNLVLSHGGAMRGRDW